MGRLRGKDAGQTRQNPTPAYLASADRFQGEIALTMGRYEEAIEAYRNATTRYQHHPEALEAFVQIAVCYRRLERNLEARGTVEHAKLVLNRMDSDASRRR